MDSIVFVQEPHEAPLSTHHLQYPRKIRYGARCCEDLEAEASQEVGRALYCRTAAARTEGVAIYVEICSHNARCGDVSTCAPMMTC